MSSVFDPALRLLEAGDVAGSVSRLLACRQHVRKSEIAANLLAFLFLRLSRCENAVEWFDAALKLRADYPEALAGRGLALQTLGRLREAVRSYDRAVLLRPNDADTYYNRGVALEGCMELDAGLQSYDAAIAKRPAYGAALLRKAAVLEVLGRLKEASLALDNLLAIVPRNADALCAKGNILQKIGRPADAVACYDKALSARPRFFAALANRAAALKHLQRHDDALQSVGAALELDPQDADMLILRGNILMDCRRGAEAGETYRHAVAIRPFKTYKAAKATPDFQALFLFSPFCSNTPYEDLIGNAGFESNVVLLMPGVHYDISALKKRADIVVNLVSDADRGQEMLDFAERFSLHFGRAVINLPRLVQGTDRLSITRLLQDVPGAIVPRMERWSRKRLQEASAAGNDQPGFPLIVRTVGTHGGDAMELCTDAAELETFLKDGDDAEYYVSRYVDYRSPDGYFRKYRFMFVGHEVLPYHLAIGEDWKIHHATTGMSDCQWMQDEERDFLDHPERVFTPQAYGALRTIAERIRLDYFGIDCSLSADGRVIVFEANPSMLVHLNNDSFPYKNEHVLRIKDAFEALLWRKAARP